MWAFCWTWPIYHSSFHLTGTDFYLSYKIRKNERKVSMETVKLPQYKNLPNSVKISKKIVKITLMTFFKFQSEAEKIEEKSCVFKWRQSIYPHTVTLSDDTLEEKKWKSGVDSVKIHIHDWISLYSIASLKFNVFPTVPEL